jgi:hypothetical protein
MTVPLPVGGKGGGRLIWRRGFSAFQITPATVSVRADAQRAPTARPIPAQGESGSPAGAFARLGRAALGWYSVALSALQGDSSPYTFSTHLHGLPHADKKQECPASFPVDPHRRWTTGIERAFGPEDNDVTSYEHCFSFSVSMSCSRRFSVIAMARSISSRASVNLPSFKRKSPRTLGSRW